MARLLTSRLLAWLILGGGGLAVVVMIYSGGAMRGAAKEFAKWQAVVKKAEEVQATANSVVNIGTASSDADLRRVEEAIKDKWRQRALEGSK